MKLPTKVQALAALTVVAAAVGAVAHLQGGPPALVHGCAVAFVLLSAVLHALNANPPAPDVTSLLGVPVLTPPVFNLLGQRLPPHVTESVPSLQTATKGPSPP